MATIGQTLSAARIAAGCSLENLSTRTRIRMQVLRGIENEDFVPCGGDFYARGHIRRICKFLGLDPAPLLEEYDREHASTGDPTFVPLPRHPSARSQATRVAAAQDGQAHTGADDDEAPQDVPRSFGDEYADPEQRAENWGHFERNQKLARLDRHDRPQGDFSTAAVPGPQRGGRHSRSGDEGQQQDAGQQEGEPGYGPATWWPITAAIGALGWNTGGTANRSAATRPAATRASTLHAESVRRHWPWAVVGLILIAAVIVGVRTWQGWDDDAPVRTASESAGSNESETVDSAMIPKEPAVERAEPVEAEPAEFTVALTASDRTWVKVSDVKGEALFTGFLTEGESQEHVTDVPLVLWIGDAGAISVAVDGQDHGPGGDSGEVKEFAVGADGFEG